MLLETVAALTVAWAITSIIESLWQPQPTLPRVGADPGPLSLRAWWARWKWYQSGHNDIIQHYHHQKTHGTNYVVHTLMGNTIVLVPKFLGELNMLPESQLSSTAALVDRVMSQYSGVDLLLRDHLTSDICRGPFTRNLPTFLPLMYEELDKAMLEMLNPKAGQDPQPHVAFELLYSITHRISSRVFVGKRHCQHPSWTRAVTDLPVNVEITKFLLLPFPSLLRRYVAPLIPQRNHIFRQRKEARDALFPPGDVVAGDEPSVLKLFIESNRDRDPDSITARLLLLTAAALHTSTMAATHALFDLCARPEHVQSLRRETELALAESNGVWKYSTVKKLRRLDSFLKESQRLNQSTFLGFDRKVISTITLSDGTILPPGSLIMVPGGPMSRDPDFYDNPGSFDGFRFYSPNAAPNQHGSSATEQDYTGIEPGNLSWGNGRFTCPGRWYGAAMIKLILGNILLRYDVSFPEGQKGRPENIKYDTEVHPDFGSKICFAKRRME
ncbi:cytochrome P450 [Stachybotrys elegans]|uniref:Cytochrome P450 n=1 Tax=Stachybotrys elegans TaxID=80388 RepID=A0A8K0WTU6_9HYPO|nr:cytochrome P450 [Stachybotrys elegans]